MLSNRNESNLRRLLLSIYVALAAIFGISLLVAAAFVWIDLFGGLIAALWKAGWLSRVVALWLVLPLSGVIIQPMARLRHLLRQETHPAPST